MTQNRLYCGDCKEVLKELIKENIKVDLVYLDPPFNSNAVYNLTYKNTSNKTTAQQKAFHDMWTPTAQTEMMFRDFLNGLEKETLIDNSVKIFLDRWLRALNEGNNKSRKLLNYLLYMTERLIMIKGVLKNTGNLYLHCDPTASHYLKVIMDGIFGSDNFRNEIIWWYDTGGMSKTDFSRKHDVILKYSMSNNYFSDIDKVKTLKNDNQLRRYEQAKKFGDTNTYRLTSEYKYPHDVWQIHAINPKAKERLGYPTQKPITLLDRIIKASCPENGVVLDPFCGCGTTIDAAIKLNRQWIGIDISTFAIDIIEERIKIAGHEDGKGYKKQYLRPKTWDEYQKLDPYKKQDFLIQSLGGMPNQKKSGDKGIDGELTIHLGVDKNKGDIDIWGKLIFSVKTGEQCTPAMLRELKGTVQDSKADIGVLILDKDPSFNMLEEVERSKKLQYSLQKDLPPQEYNTIQIYTAEQILNGVLLASPPPMHKIEDYRRLQLELFKHDNT